jgi:hypothetical protein
MSRITAFVSSVALVASVSAASAGGLNTVAVEDEPIVIVKRGSSSSAPGVGSLAGGLTTGQLVGGLLGLAVVGKVLSGSH